MGTHTIRTDHPTQYFSQILPLCQRSCVTLLLSLASELLISLFVKTTVAGSISSVAHPSEWKSVIPLAAHLAEVRGYHSDCCDSSTLAYS